MNRVWEMSKEELRSVLIALWLGAAIFTVAVVAPVAFQVLPTRELAGTMVGRTLDVLHISGCIIGLLLLLGACVESNQVNEHVRSRRWRTTELVALAVLTLASALNQFVIDRRITALRAEINRAIDELAASDPLRQEFGKLHGLSVLVLSVAIIAGVVALIAVVRRRNFKAVVSN